ncbi:hypothetical protein IMCC3317_15610 [Kordia antarctica]|uniref:DUF1684 domain-containing protein n=1 Tax=Kordia antarctica TaxID=1218801 RepID=A0A7L4ZHU7_9FLAO|nr:DUF1684 domain-containing protein [Kordia antarctica]QHI36202.1 hypothetical protein IMCC3317_15610 [Kordia antarctica]
MKNTFLILCVLVMNVSCSQEKTALIGETEFQRELNAEYKDASTSPLKPKDLKTFNALAFFPVNDTFKVTASFKLTPDSKPFKMKTSTARTPIYKCYGIATFKLNGKEYSLEIYKNQDPNQDPKYKDDLFLPFTDETNGFASYGGGRYIDLTIPAGNTIEINFNNAYNPYCAYSDRYSCPVPPRVNFLKTEINAGVKAFEKH